MTTRTCSESGCDRIVEKDWCRDHGPHWWDHVKAPPKPKQHETNVDRLLHLTEGLLDGQGNDAAYRWAYNASHGEHVGERVGSGGGGPADPTATIVTARQGIIRAHLRQYDDAIREAVQALERARLHRAVREATRHRGRPRLSSRKLSCPTAG